MPELNTKDILLKTKDGPLKTADVLLKAKDGCNFFLMGRSGIRIFNKDKISSGDGKRKG